MVKIMKIGFDVSGLFIVGFAMNVYLSYVYCIKNPGFFKFCAAVWKIEFLLAGTVKQVVTFMILKWIVATSSRKILLVFFTYSLKPLTRVPRK